MAQVYTYQVDEMIEALNKSGANVSSETHAIYAHPETVFTSGLYPLEIMLTESMPEGTACIISKKPEEIE